MSTNYHRHMFKVNYRSTKARCEIHSHSFPPALLFMQISRKVNVVRKTGFYFLRSIFTNALKTEYRNTMSISCLWSKIHNYDSDKWIQCWKNPSSFKTEFQPMWVPVNWSVFLYREVSLFALYWYITKLKGYTFTYFYSYMNMKVFYKYYH